MPTGVGGLTDSNSKSSRSRFDISKSDRSVGESSKSRVSLQFR